VPFFSPHHLIELLHAHGNVVLGVVIALETVGLPLPGETLLIAAAVLAAGTTDQMNIAFVVLSAALGAIAGQIAGYAIGWGVGFRLLRRYGGKIGLTERRLALGRTLFARHGLKVIAASRFVVFLRSVAGLLAGAGHMPWVPFLAGNLLGSIAWSAFYGIGAYLLGHEAKRMAGPVAAGIGVTVAGVLLATVLYARRRERELLDATTQADQVIK
jgi:membrane protein DedA with SNARE-associated domain